MCQLKLSNIFEEYNLYSTQLLKNMLRCFSLDIIRSEKWTVFQEQSSRKIVCFSQLIISTDKYMSIFSHQIYSFLAGFCYSPGWDSNFLYKGNCACKWGLGETTPQRRQNDYWEQLYIDKTAHLYHSPTEVFHKF